MTTGILVSSKVKIPHVGWSSIVPADNATWNDTILENTHPGKAVYFVHSYMSNPTNNSSRLANCIYGDNIIAAVIRKENVFGCQFHPEKSGNVGLKILEKFLKFT
jgi:glutamine amidotransferase